jgi:Chromosome segregation ATPases
MRNLSVPPLLAALVFLVAMPAFLRAEDDPGELFMQAYGEFRAAEKLETEGRGSDALTKYRFCASLLEQIGQKFPTYQPLVIQFRLGKSREAIARVEGALNSRSNLPPLPPSLESNAEPSLTAPSTVRPAAPSFRIPTRSGAGATPRALSSRGGGDLAIGRGASPSVARELEDLRSRLRDSERRASELERQVLQEKAEKQSAYKELDLTKVQVVELKSRLAQAGQRLRDLEISNEALANEKAAETHRVVELERDLDEVRAELEVVEESNSELFARLEKAAEFIEASEAIRKQLLADRKELAAEIAGGSDAATKKLRNEIDRLIEENRKFKEQVTGIPAIEQRNAELSARLADAEKRAEALEKERDAGRVVEEELRKEVGQLNGSIAALQDEIKAGRNRVAELERQFEETSAATTAATGAMASENALLKEILQRQIREQARRQQARKLVAEEMEKLQIRSGTLLEKLNVLAAAEVALTPAEEKLLRKPEVALSASGVGNSFELSVAKVKMEDDPLAEGGARDAHSASDDHALPNNDGVDDEASEAYRAALNQGIASHHSHNYADAISAFRRALEIRPDAAAALTNLGISELRSGNVEAAKETLRKAVQANGATHLAHYFLGLALQQEGDIEGAIRQARRSIELKPDYEPALELEEDLQAATPPQRPAAGAKP